MGRTDRAKQDKVDSLQNELECLKDEWESNQSEQMELRSIGRGLQEDINKIETELEDLGVEESYD